MTASKPERESVSESERAAAPKQLIHYNRIVVPLNYCTIVWVFASRAVPMSLRVEPKYSAPLNRVTGSSIMKVRVDFRQHNQNAAFGACGKLCGTETNNSTAFKMSVALHKKKKKKKSEIYRNVCVGV